MTSPSATVVRSNAQILFRRWKTVTCFSLVVVLLAIAVMLTWPRAYTSRGKLLVRIGSETATLDPTAMTGPTVMVETTQEHEINSLLEVLAARRVSEEVVKRIGVQRVLDDVLIPLWIKAGLDAVDQGFQALRDGPLRDGPTQLGIDERYRLFEAVKVIQSRIGISAPKLTKVVNISAKAGSPELAQRMVEVAIEVFLEEHARLQQVEGSLDFFRAQMDGLRSELLSEQQELRDRKNEFGVVTIVGKQSNLEDRVKDIDLETVRTQRELAFAEAQVRDLTEKVASLAAEVVTESISGFANEARDGMRTRLYELEIVERELRQKYTDTHPLVVASELQRRELESILDNQSSARTRTTSSLNPTRQALDVQLKSQHANVEALRAKMMLLDRQRESASDDLVAMNDHEIELTELERRVDLLEANYRAHAEKMEQARIEFALGQQRISSINEIQPPSYEPEPVSPKRRVLAVLAALVGLTGGISLAYLREFLDPTLATAEQAQAQLNLPVLAQVPYDRSGTEMLLSRVRHHENPR